MFFSNKRPMKKLKYNDELPKNGIYIVVTMIASSIGAICSLIKMINDHSINPMLMVVTIFLLILIGSIVGLKGFFDTQKKYKTIKEKGTKVDGFIETPYEEYKTDMFGRTNYHYYLLVKYKNPETNQEVEYKTPRLGFNPFRYIKSQKCSVYLYNNEKYVSDYDYAEKAEDSLWHTNVADNEFVSDLIAYAIKIGLYVLMCCIIVAMLVIMYI